MSNFDQFQYEEEEKRGFLSRWGFLVGIAVVAVIGVFLFRQVFANAGSGARAKPPEVVMIRPLPPPPPPPPPITPPPQIPKQEMITQTPLNDQDTKPDDKPPDPAPALGTNIQGNGGPDGFGLGRGGGNGLGGNGGGGARASQFGWYARELVGAFSDALRSNPDTRDAVFSVRVRVWLDHSGRVTRVKLADSTGVSTIDAALRERALVGLQLSDPPPEAMPMPVTVRLTASRTN